MLSNTRWMEVPKIVSAFQMRPAAKDNMVVKDSQAAAAALVAALVSTVISQVANNDSITGVVNATGGVDAKSRVTNSFNVVQSLWTQDPFLLWPLMNSRWPDNTYFPIYCSV